MKRLLITTAAIETGAGVALICFPSATVTLLVGAPLTTPAAVSTARVGAAGLLALGVACWFARGDAQSDASRGLVAAMLLYNLGAVVVLAASGISSQPVGVALWPAVVLHTAMALWCVTCFLRTPAWPPSEHSRV